MCAHCWELPGIQHLQSCTISEPQKKWVWIASCIANELQILSFINSYLITFLDYTWRRITSYNWHKQTHALFTAVSSMCFHVQQSWERKSFVLPITYHNSVSSVTYAAVIQRSSYPTSATFRRHCLRLQWPLSIISRNVLSAVHQTERSHSPNYRQLDVTSILKAIFITELVNFWYTTVQLNARPIG